jgi:hypothetical protein
VSIEATAASKYTALLHRSGTSGLAQKRCSANHETDEARMRAAISARMDPEER